MTTRYLIATLLLAFLLSVPVFAQEATQASEPTPTVETIATEVAAPVSEVPADNDFFVALFNSDIVWQIITIVAMFLLARSVPQSAIDKLKTDAAKTDTPVDDLGARLLELLNKNPSLIPDFFKRDTQPTTTVTTGNGTDTTITVSQPNVGNTGSGVMDVSTPPVTVYPATPTTAFTDTFGKRGNNGYTWHEEGHADAVIEIPDGYDYRLDNHNGNRDWQPYKAVNTNEQYGTRLNITQVAGQHQFIRKQRVQLGVGAHEIVLSYVADVKHDENQHPMYNWIWSEAFIDGQPVIVGIGDVNHRALQNGVHTATWLFDNRVAREVTLSFTVTVHWAQAQGDSWINLRTFGLQGAILVG
jgi:hypothetical protein